MTAGANLPWLDDLGYGLLGGGGLFALGAVAFLVAGLRRPGGPSAAPVTGGAAPAAA
ncbi:MAG TPA: hypothetical protein VF529_09425 [Solirubrobacteraceae bacterium]